MNNNAEPILEDAKLAMGKLQSIFGKMMDEYHNPVGFIAQVDALIQAIRNFTFFLQSKKNSIDDFGAWYSPWQEAMGGNPYMRFIVDMRNSIAKQGLNATKSHALVTLFTDYRQTLYERKLDVYSTTTEIINETVDLTSKKPSLKHATGEISRLYIFNYDKKKDLEVVDTLFYCQVFISKLFEDFQNFLTTGSIQPELPRVIAPSIDVSDLKVMFRVRDGERLGRNTMHIERDDDAIEAYRKKHGSINLKHDINSDDVAEKLRARIELTQTLRRKSGDILPTLEYYSDLTGEWSMMMLRYRDRAEKILFWKDFAKQAVKEKISKFYFTSDTWAIPPEQTDAVLAAIQAGREISTLPSLKESLIAYYLENSGRIVIARSFYEKNKSRKLTFQKTEVEEGKPEHHAMFAAVFDAWGVKNIENN